MPNEPQTPKGTASTQPNTGEAPSSMNPDRQPTGAQDVGFRFQPGPDVPDWAVGKTPQELLSMTKQLYNTPYTPQSQQQQWQQPQPAQPQYTPPSDDEWLTRPTEAFNKAAQGIVQQQFAPQMQALMYNQAMANKMLVQQKFNDEFNRWGPEIEGELRKIPLESYTPDNLQLVVDLVRGRHARELQQEQIDREIQRRMEAGSITRPSAEDATTSLDRTDTVDLDSEELPAAYRQILKLQGVNNLRELDSFLLKYYGPDTNLRTAREQWFEKAKAGRVIIENAKGAFRREFDPPTEAANG